MAQAVDQRTPKTLDDAARFLIEERGYEKNPALCWEILEQIRAGRIKLRRHWKKYDLNGNPQEDGAEVVDRAVFHGRNLEFDRHGHIKSVPEWGDDRYTIVEPCDFRIIWPPPLILQPSDTTVASPLKPKAWLPDEHTRRKQQNDIPKDITTYGQQLHETAVEAVGQKRLTNAPSPRRFETLLHDLGLFPKIERRPKHARNPHD